MRSFNGKCHGGPHDGQMLAHWAKKIEFFRPMQAFTLRADPPVEAVTIGWYWLNDYGQWHWHPTKEGDAFDVLFGEAGKK